MFKPDCWLKPKLSLFNYITFNKTVVADSILKLLYTYIFPQKITIYCKTFQKTVNWNHNLHIDIEEVQTIFPERHGNQSENWFEYNPCKWRSFPPVCMFIFSREKFEDGGTWVQKGGELVLSFRIRKGNPCILNLSVIRWITLISAMNRILQLQSKDSQTKLGSPG